MTTIHPRGGSANDPAQTALFTRLFTEDRGFVLRVLRRCGVPERDLQDVAQEVYEVAYRRLPDLDPTRTARPWLYVIASFAASNYRTLARHQREQYAADVPEEPAEQESVEAILIEEQEKTQLRERVSRLRPKLRAMVEAYVFEGRSMTDIIASLGIPEKTGHSRLRLAREALSRHAMIE